VTAPVLAPLARPPSRPRRLPRLRRGALRRGVPAAVRSGRLPAPGRDARHRAADVHGRADAAAGLASISVDTDAQFPTEKYLALWSGRVQFSAVPKPQQYRLLIREYEYVSANWAIVHPGGEALPPWSEAPGRLIYAETVEIDEAFVVTS